MNRASHDGGVPVLQSAESMNFHGMSGAFDDPWDDVDAGSLDDVGDYSEGTTSSMSSAGGMSKYLTHFTESFFSFMFAVVCKSSEEWNADQLRHHESMAAENRALFKQELYRTHASTTKRDSVMATTGPPSDGVFVWEPSRMSLRSVFDTTAKLLGHYSPWFDFTLLLLWLSTFMLLVAYPYWIHEFHSTTLGYYIATYGIPVSAVSAGLVLGFVAVLLLGFLVFQSYSEVSKLWRLSIIYYLKVVVRTVPVQCMLLLFFLYDHKNTDTNMSDVSTFVMLAGLAVAAFSALAIWVVFFPSPLSTPYVSGQCTQVHEVFLLLSALSSTGCHVIFLTTEGGKYSGWLGFFTLIALPAFLIHRLPYHSLLMNISMCMAGLYALIFHSFLLPFGTPPEQAYSGTSSINDNSTYVPFLVAVLSGLVASCASWMRFSSCCLGHVSWNPIKFKNAFLRSSLPRGYYEMRTKQHGRQLVRISPEQPPVDVTATAVEEGASSSDGDYAPDNDFRRSGAISDMESGEKWDPYVDFVMKCSSDTAFDIKFRTLLKYITTFDNCMESFADEKTNPIYGLLDICASAAAKFPKSDLVSIIQARTLIMFQCTRQGRSVHKILSSLFTRIVTHGSTESVAVSAGSLGLFSCIGQWSTLFESWWLMRLRETVHSWTHTSDSAWLFRQLSKVDIFRQAILNAQSKFWKLLSEADTSAIAVADVLMQIVHEIEEHEKGFGRLVKKLQSKHPSNVRVIRACAVYSEIVDQDDAEARRLLAYAEELEEQSSFRAQRTRSSISASRRDVASSRNGRQQKPVDRQSTQANFLRQRHVNAQRDGQDGVPQGSKSADDMESSSQTQAQALGAQRAQRQKELLRRNSHSLNRVWIAVITITVVLFVVGCLLFGTFMATVKEPFRNAQRGQPLSPSLTFDLLQAIAMKVPLSRGTYLATDLWFHVGQRDNASIAILKPEMQSDNAEYAYRMVQFLDKTLPSSSLRKILSTKSMTFSVPKQNASASDPESSFSVEPVTYDVFHALQTAERLQAGFTDCVNRYTSQGVDVFAKPGTECSLIFYEIALNTRAQVLESLEPAIYELQRELKSTIDRIEWTMYTVVICANSIIAVVFLILFVPSVITLYRERAAIAKLFLLVPKRTASELSRAARSKMQSISSANVEMSQVVSVSAASKRTLSPHVMFLIATILSVVLLALLAQINVVPFSFYVSDLRNVQSEVHVFEDVHQHFWEIGGLLQSSLMKDQHYMSAANVTVEELLAESNALADEVEYHWMEVLYGTDQIGTKPADLQSDGDPVSGCAYRSPEFTRILISGDGASRVSSEFVAEESDITAERDKASLTAVVFRLLDDIRQVTQLPGEQQTMEPSPAVFEDYIVRAKYEFSYQLQRFFKVYETFYDDRVRAYKSWAIALFIVLLFAFVVLLSTVLFPSLDKMRQENIRHRKMLLLVPEEVIESVSAIKAFLENNQRSDKRDIQATIRAREERMQSILACASEGFIELDEKGSIAQYNRAAQLLFGYEPSEVLGERLTRLFVDDHENTAERGRTAEILTNLLADCRRKVADAAVGSRAPVEELNASTLTKDQQLIHLHISMSVIPMSRKEFITTLFIRDVTTEKQKSALLAQEKARSESLLTNILPRSIATRLSNGERNIADAFENVTVLFFDLVGFTSMSSRMPPKDLVETLNHVFSGFDDIIIKNGCEKIKTIGDAIMVASGLPEPRPDHARALVQTGLEFIEHLKSVNAARGLSLNCRIGLNSGPVVAGVIGKIRTAFDIWSDTVNVASRMESTSLSGRIQVSRSTYELTYKFFDYEERSSVEVKGKGQMQCYLVIGPSKKE